ncbi:copper amine oxidase N-terminal domain-containing protein [Acetivibrio clariflavus]|uniref:Copper amine oxidase family protein n=1 Tax=Acetivibrio clariflavus (strain DSM 19732 / NBRC 101661 / EBR45) TaxID=720554 RepID=G8M338_ACECE|nr:copper amine oxidase N-terminal domain-containing protein [Acetivibrio clariflavus]AEV69347.1 copper amine oxidase family protein [Acetivibrio clariflavus DSM 19732]
MLKTYFKFLTVVFIIIILTSTVGVAEIPLRVVVNGEKVNFPDAQPFIDENGRTQVPVRFVSEALGANVDWNGDAKKVTVTLNSRKVVLTIGLKTYEINNQTYQMDTVALLKESRTFVPIRFVSEALGATVTWDQNARSVYIKFDPKASPPPLPTPLAGTTKYYDGIAFNDVTDVDQYGRMSMDKTKEFTLKLANQLSFIKENGKYYIKCDYPEIPEGYEWSLGIRIFNKDGSYIGYNPITRVPGCQIPKEGSFKKEATHIKNLSNIRNFSISISINDSKDDNTGILNILYYLDGSEKWVIFVPYISLYREEKYTDNFDFKKMFQW